MEILKIVIWPCVVFILVITILILFRNTLVDLVKRITKLKYGDTIAEVSQIQQSTTDKNLVNNSENNKPNANIEKFLGILSSATLERAETVLEIETRIDEAKDEKEVIALLKRYAQAAYVIHQFERLYFIIYGSQINMLEYCNSHPSQTKEELQPFYNVAKERYPDSYDSYEYDDYFNFLVREELLTSSKTNEFGKEVYGITWLGRDFLKYIIETAKPAKSF